MKQILILLMFVGTMLPASAQQKSKNAKYEIEVSGNCGQCKKRIEKAAFGVSGVKSAVWDETTQVLTLILNEEKTSLAQVEKAIVAVGHDTQNLRAADSVYENLHHCCKYERLPSVKN